ncbi:MAG: DUF5654 family protein [Candidatus Daviesbacteria bacterium]|nr:DUF5654 family protein [Candidatus Daviesbacteria bacterium]
MAISKKSKVQKEKSFKEELVSQMLNLATSGFGLVAALAWNEAIQSFVKEYIEKFFPVSSGVIFRFFYAILLTILVVLVIYQLSKLAAKLHRHQSD